MGFPTISEFAGKPIQRMHGVVDHCVGGSVDLLDSWATGSSTTCGTTHVWHAASRHAISTTSSLVDLHHDWIYNAFELLLLGLEFILLGQLVLVQPVKGFLDCLLNLVFVICLKFVLQLFLLQRVAHGEAIVL